MNYGKDVKSLILKCLPQQILSLNQNLRFLGFIKMWSEMKTPFEI